MKIFMTILRHAPRGSFQPEYLPLIKLDLKFSSLRPFSLFSTRDILLNACPNNNFFHLPTHTDE